MGQAAQLAGANEEVARAEELLPALGLTEAMEVSFAHENWSRGLKKKAYLASVCNPTSWSGHMVHGLWGQAGATF